VNREILNPTASHGIKYALDAVFVAFLLLGALYFFKDALLGIRTLIWDAADYYYPYLFFVSDSFRHGDIPLWSPFLFNGFPSVGDIQAQTFYPPNFLFMIFTTFSPYAVHLSLVLHFCLAGVFMYFLSRHYLQNRWACAISALAYMLSGYMVGHIEHLTIIDLIAWLPLVFLLLEKAMMINNVAYAFIAGLFFGVSILAGHPQSTHAIIFVLIIHALYRATNSYVREKKKALFLRPILVLSICLGVGLLISAVQIIPTYELTKESLRAGALSFEVAAGSGQLRFSDAVILFMPNYFGAVSGPYWDQMDISQSLLYIGIMPLFFIGLALINARKRPDIIYFFIMALFSLMVSLGEHGFIFRLLYDYVPGFDHFRSPVNTAFIFTFFGALLAGQGFNVLSQKVKKRTLFIYFGIFLALGLILHSLGPVPSADIGDAAIQNINSGLAFFVVFLSVSAVVVTLSVHFPEHKNIYFSILLLFTFADLFINLSDSMTIGEKAPPGLYEKEAEIITRIKGGSGIASGAGPGIELNASDLAQGLYRVYTQPTGNAGTAVFGFNRAMLHRMFLVEGYEPLEMSRHRKLIDVLSVSNLDNLLKISNAKYITSMVNNNVDLKNYPGFLPRAYIVPNARFRDNDDRVLEELAVFDPSSEVIISGKGTDIAGRTMAASEWSSTVSRYTGNLVEIRTQSVKDGFLVLSDTYYPGWRAWIDGVGSPVMRANYDFRALQLPAGEHTVVFKFTPRYLTLGLFMGLGGIFLVGFVFLKMWSSSRVVTRESRFTVF
jgi:hypothetical protein